MFTQRAYREANSRLLSLGGSRLRNGTVQSRPVPVCYTFDVELSIETIGEALRRRRKELGLTQAQLAARLGTTQSYVAQIERAARRAVRWQTVQDFARELDLEPFLVPRERVAELSWLLQASPDEEAPPLTGGSWDD